MALREEAGAASLPRRPGARDRKLSVYGFRHPDTVENILYGLVSYREKFVGNLELYLSTVLLRDHPGEAVQSYRAGDRFREHQCEGCVQEFGAERGDKLIRFLIDGGNADDRGIIPHHRDLLRRSVGEPPRNRERYRKGTLDRFRTAAMVAAPWEKR